MNILHPWWLYLAIATVAIVLVIVGLGIYLMYPAFKMPSPPDFETPNDQAEANRQDLAYLKSALHEVDRSFSPAEWAAFDRVVDDLSKRAETLDAAALEMGIARAVAVADNGHTHVLGAGWGLTLNSIPLRFYWFGDDLRIVKADPAHADLLGARVLAIGGHAPDALADVFRSYVGGRESRSRELSIHFMESPQVLHAVGLQDSSSTARLTLETIGGEVVARNVTAAPIPVNGSPPARYFSPIGPRRALSPVPVPADPRQWAHVLDDTSVPFTLREPDRHYWATHLADGQVVFLRINATSDEPGREPLERFLEQTLDEVAARRPRFAIVDLRSNPGGNYLLTASFTRKLPALIPGNGRIFIVTSASTFSAGIVTVARLKYFSGARAEIVGEPMGDYSRFWAESAARIVLPNSGLRVGYATRYHDWGNGCSLGQILICYPLNHFYGVAAGDLDPTVPVSWSFADYLEGKDTAIEEIMRIVAAAERRGPASTDP